MRSLVVAALTVVVASSALGGCGKHGYTRDDLDVALFQHHANLRWGRLENASLNVKPEMRGAFLTAWAQRMQEYELQDVEVTGVAMSPDGDNADVVVTVTYVDKASMTVKNVAVPEHWIRTDDGWVVDKPAAL
jgi:hypothetical protein